MPTPPTKPAHAAPADQSVRQRDRRNFLMTSGLVVLWCFSRLLMLRVFILPNASFITGDVKYYQWWMASGLPDTSVLREYPLPVVWSMRILYWAGGDSYFLPAFATTMLLLDALFTIVIWHDGHRRGALWWTLFVPLLGPLMWNRFDMVPAVCMGLAALWYRRHPAASGVMVALGAAVKLWPALLILPMLSRRRASIRRLVSFAITGGALALASLFASGWDRLVSPLTWQSDRGLQIEAVPATVPMARRSLVPSSGLTVEFSKFNAYEIFGPGVSTWQTISSSLMYLAVLTAVLLGILAWRRGGLDHRSAVLAGLVIIGALIVANKTLSPQYFVWWAAPVAMILDPVSAETLNPSDDAALRRTRTWCLVVAGLVLVVAALTQYIYPLHYSAIIGTPPRSWGVSLLCCRNGMAVVTLCCCILALRSSLHMHRPAQPVVIDTPECDETHTFRA